jgi:flavocytochrome c
MEKVENLAEWDEIFDVIVIGSGFAGLATAIEARNQEATVVIIEKMSAPGGNSIISDGGIAAAGTNMQQKLGIEDSPELMYRDIMQAGLNLNHPDLVREVAERSNEVFQWSIDYLGVEYLDRVDIFGGHSVPRCYTAKGVSGATIIKRQLSKLSELGVKVRTRVCFTDFVVSGNKRVVGVVVRDGWEPKNSDSGTKRRIGAKKAVILTTGGFGGDIPFRSVQDPRLTADVDTTNKPFTTAEALKEALRIGANPVHLSQIQLGPWASPDEKGYGVATGFADYIVFQYGIIVSPLTGKRIVNELADRKTVADAILKVGRPCVGIADKNAVIKSGWNIDKCLKKGVVREFEYISDLVSHYQIPAHEIETTLFNFSNYVENNSDTDFSKPILPGALPIATQPYYGIRLWPKVHYTMGGLQINLNAQVIDLDLHPIQGFYASGEVTGGIHGACRLGSCAITDCLVFGRIAGENAAREKTK